MTVTQDNFIVQERLRNGEAVLIRPLKDGDRRTVNTVWSHLSPLSVYHRFFSPKKELSEADLEYLSHVDFKKHVALTVCVRDKNDELEPVAIGRYIVTEEDPDTAEVAFAVDDPYQGLGIGTILMRQLAIIARSAGIKRFLAYVLTENTRMMAVFNHSGLPIKKTMADGSTYEVELSLD